MLSFALSGVVQAATSNAENAIVFSQQFGEARWTETLSQRIPETDPDYDRVESVARRLAIAFASQYSDRTWTLRLIKTHEEPAATLPGNRILVAKYAIDKWSDDALAFAIAHEMGHVQLDHYEARFRKLLTLANLDGARVTTWKDCMRYSAGIPNFKAQQEFDADKFGVRLARSAGFDGFAGLREVLSTAPEDADHPPNATRIERATAY